MVLKGHIIYTLTSAKQHRQNEKPRVNCVDFKHQNCTAFCSWKSTTKDLIGYKHSWCVGKTELHYLVICQLICKSGIDISKVDHKRITLLSEFEENGFTQVCKMLIIAGAVPDHQDK